MRQRLKSMPPAALSAAALAESGPLKEETADGFVRIHSLFQEQLCPMLIRNAF